ncbi:phage terminase small subunit P27 family [Lapidilactobacillus wuchangensis]|uniref:phage terminase small subunit P27 family n=1 Tax=Lapidilactobacillus wuchangensis TaxID=2486001 RepID=UPI000F79AF4F|nr:phage terminase small subunit P27 family [Lapidilactobacillus wuchangensis]
MGAIVKKSFKDQDNGMLPKRPPSYLGKIAAAMWRKVVPVLESQSAVQRIDANLVETYCSAYEIYRESYQSIKEDGIQTEIYVSLQNNKGEIVGSEFRGYKKNPATGIFNDASKQLTLIGTQLGLSPKSRAELTNLRGVKTKNSSGNVKQMNAEKAKFFG